MELLIHCSSSKSLKNLCHISEGGDTTTETFEGGL
jgi:hypothetical protein